MATKKKSHDTITMPATATVDVETDVDIDKDVLADHGYHHESDCDGQPTGPDSTAANRRALLDWHDETHGLTGWPTCKREPCVRLALDFRETP